jgi:hypothetical protein
MSEKPDPDLETGPDPTFHEIPESFSDWVKSETLEIRFPDPAAPRQMVFPFSRVLDGRSDPKDAAAVVLMRASA